MGFFLGLLMGLVVLSGIGSVEADSNALSPAFSDSSLTVPMPDSWVKQPIDRGPVDLNVMLDQQMYRVLKPVILAYAKKHNLEMALSDGTCGNSAGALIKKKVGYRSFLLSSQKFRPPDRVEVLYLGNHPYRSSGSPG